jgi:hypothetical protein
MGEYRGRTPSSIDLVWTLRVIEAKRTLLLPFDPDNLRELIDLGLVELRPGEPRPLFGSSL